MDRTSCVKNVYGNLTSAFLRNIDSGNQQIAEMAYTAYLHRTYDALFQNASEAGLGSAVSFLVRRENLRHLSLDEGEKLSFLFPHDTLLELQKARLEVRDMARAKRQGYYCRPPRSREEYDRELDAVFRRAPHALQEPAQAILTEIQRDLNYIFD